MKSERVLQAVLSAALAGTIAGCHRSTVNAQSGPDPAAANLAQPGTENEAQQQAAQYSGSAEAGQQPPAPIERAYPNAPDQPYAADDSYDQQYEPVYDDSLTDEQAAEPPPPLPDYDQPPDPDPDYIWTPGYWAWGPEGYYWVPGAWVEPPYVGALWTPGYWGYVGNVYRFHHGYWGRHIGFYGGVDYGFGYDGMGYEGGYWNGPHFYYNTAVTHVDRDRVRDVYAHNVVVDNHVTNGRPINRTSFNGGRGGLQARPQPAEVAALHEQRYAPTQSQTQVRDQASQNRQQFYSANHGRPAEAVAARPVVNDHRMPAALPPVAAVGAQRGAGGPNPGNRPAETGRPGQFQQGAQQNVPRGGSAPEAQHTAPVQPNNPAFRRGQETRPMQPQNEVRPQSPPQPRPSPQAQPRPEQHAAPQSQQQHPESQQRPESRPQPQQARPQAPPPQTQRPEFQQRPQSRPQAPPPQAQHSAPPQAQHHGPPPQAQHPRPQPQHQAPPQHQPHDDDHHQ